MSHRNEQLLRTSYEAFVNGDVGPLLASFAEDIHWHVSGPSPLAGDYSGADVILAFFGRMQELYGGTLRLEVLDVLANDDHGIVLTRERGEHGGRTAEYEGVHRWDSATASASASRTTTTTPTTSSGGPSEPTASSRRTSEWWSDVAPARGRHQGRTRRG
jgi:ketosteroid isomerase-like protein